jgi:hypothetical protein
MADSPKCEYKQGSWRSTLHTSLGRNVDIFILGGPKLMESADNQIHLRSLMDSSDELIDNASRYARESEYRDEISMADGLLESSIIVTTWDDLKVWFCLGRSGRMLAVWMRQGKPVDVYCEHP